MAPVIAYVLATLAVAEVIYWVRVYCDRRNTWGH